MQRKSYIYIYDFRNVIIKAFDFQVKENNDFLYITITNRSAAPAADNNLKYNPNNNIVTQFLFLITRKYGTTKRSLRLQVNVYKAQIFIHCHNISQLSEKPCWSPYVYWFFCVPRLPFQRYVFTVIMFPHFLMLSRLLILHMLKNVSARGYYILFKWIHYFKIVKC